MKDEKSRAALMTACTLSVIQLMELHRSKTGTPMEHMLRDMLALPIWITTQVSEAEHAEDNMLLTMAGYKAKKGKGSYQRRNKHCLRRFSFV